MDVTSAGNGLEPDNSDMPGQEAGLLDQVLGALTALQESFDAKIRYDEVKERQIAAQHQELEKHRQGLYQQILGPVLADLIGIYDEIAKQIADSDSDDAVREMSFLPGLLEMVEEVLGRYGAAKFACEGDGIDRSRQRVIDVQPTDVAELGRRLARRLRPGFEAGGKVIRPEWVIAYRYTPDTETQPAD